jgi:protein arginine kinase activator
MKCDKCTKKATVHLTEIVDGKVMEMHLCEDCARDQSEHMEQQFGLADLLAGLTDFGKQVPNASAAEPKEVLQCPSCGLTYEDFRKGGRFGCAECYVAFKPQLKTLFKQIHGSSNHLGKKPAVIVPLKDKDMIHLVPAPEAAAPLPAAKAPSKAASAKETVQALREKLQQAIGKEDFEEAARLRDRIHAIEGGK